MYSEPADIRMPGFKYHHKLEKTPTQHPSEIHHPKPVVLVNAHKEKLMHFLKQLFKKADAMPRGYPTKENSIPVADFSIDWENKEELFRILQDMGFSVVRYRNTPGHSVEFALQHDGMPSYSIDILYFYFKGRQMRVNAERHIQLDESKTFDPDLQFLCIKCNKSIAY